MQIICSMYTTDDLAGKFEPRTRNIADLLN
jgi:hypothetical protein